MSLIIQNPPENPMLNDFQMASQDWQQFARDVIEELRHGPLVYYVFETEKLPERQKGPLSVLKDETAAWADMMSPTDVEQAVANGEDPFRVAVSGEGDSKPPKPKLIALQSILRLCRYFGSKDDMVAALCKPGAITLIETRDQELAVVLVEILDALMSTHRCSPQVTFMTDATAKHSDAAFHGLTREISNALQSSRPLILICPSRIALPLPISKLKPQVISLPKLSQQILLEHLRYSHSETGRIAEQLVTPHLLPDVDLTRLDLLDFCLCLRASSPRQVAMAISDTLRQGQSGPKNGLAGFPLETGVRQALDGLVADLHDWRSGTIPWSDVTRGILLAGPPGVGKTEIARRIAADTGIALHAGSISEWQAAGKSSEFLTTMRQFFEKAAAEAPAIVFIDELDGIGDRNRSQDHNSAYTDFIVTALLSHIDGFTTTEGVALLAATNHVQKIDAALRRPGRFDQTLHIPLPGPEFLPEVLRFHLADDLGDVDLSQIAARLFGQSPAEIAGLVRRARSLARRQRRPFALSDFESVINTYCPPLSTELRWRIAVHEAGHAVATAALGHGRPKMLMIAARGGFAEKTLLDGAKVADGIDAEITVALAGRAAETLVLGQPSTGAGGGPGSDLAHASKLAAAAEVSYGLGKCGQMWRAPAHHAISLLETDPYAKAAVEQRLERADRKAKQIIRENSDALLCLAELLNQKSMVMGEELDQLLASVKHDGEVSELAAKRLHPPS